jgi:hypothetical protein
MAPQLRLIPTDPPSIDEAGDRDDGTLGGKFAALADEIHRVLAHGRGSATESTLGGVTLHLLALADDFAGVAMPEPSNRT